MSKELTDLTSLGLPIKSLRKWRDIQASELARLGIIIKHHNQIIEDALMKIYEVKKDLDAIDKTIVSLEKWRDK